MRIKELVVRLENLDRFFPIMVGNVMRKRQKELTQAQHDQLWDGKRSDGWDIRPYYTEDTYFRSYEEAREYMDWKRRITPNPRRRADAPNLYINGKFYSQIKVVADEKGIETVGTTGNALRIMGKYSRGTFGVNPVNAVRVFRETGGLTELVKDIKKALKL